MSNINSFPRSSVISFVPDMIHFHKHDQTLIDPRSLNKTGHVLTFDKPLSHRFSSRTKSTVLKYWDDFARTISQYYLKGYIRTDSGY